MKTIPSDFSSAIRQIGRHRAFSAIVIVTLALGIGASTTFFSILNALVYRPLAFSDPDHLVAVDTFERHGATPSASYESIVELARSAPVLRSVVGYMSRDINAAGADSAARVVSTQVSGDLFGLLGASFSLGRPFAPEEYRSHAAVAVISYTFWTRHYMPDAVVAGRTIVLDGTPHEIVGVAPENFRFPADTDIWVPMGAGTSQRSVGVVARLQDGVTVAHANAVLNGASVGADPAVASSLPLGANVILLRESMVSSKHRGIITAMLFATFLILLIACANLAGLLAAHLGSRRHEIAVRTALGARRSRIVSLLLIESAVLAVVGGAFGTLVAQWGIDLFDAALGKPQGQGWLNFSIDGRVLLFAFGVSLATALLVGLIPALGATRVDLRGVLVEDARAAGVGPRGRRLRAALVGTQMAVSLGLIAAASSIVSSSMAFGAIGSGFDRERLVVLHVTLAGRAYDSAAARVAFVDRVLAGFAVLPGVSTVSATSHLPLADRDVPSSRVELEGSDPKDRRFASLRFVAGSYLRTVRIPIKRGRSFSEPEAADPRTLLVLVNETMVRRYWPDANPLGKRLRVPDSPYEDAWLTVAGVVGDVAERNPGHEPGNQIYLPLAHSRDISFVVRATHDDAAIVMPARRAIAAIDGGLPLNARTMRDVYAWYARERKMQGFVLASLGLVALLLSALGVYAVMALLVSQERREFAIRLALGSSNEALHRLVLGRSLRTASAGIGAGLLLASIMTSLLSGMFFGVRPFDLRTMAAAAAVVAATALFASWWPARRAMKVDPMTVLRI